MFGKSGLFLPNIGKMQKSRGGCRASSSFHSSLFTLHCAAAMPPR
jgi:hypothetical protein